jgi:2'-5' RNA ligase
MHLTLKFLGDITSEMAERVTDALRQACSETRPFGLALSGTGAFPSMSNPRVLWVGLSGDLGPLGAMQERIELGMERLGFEREARGFSPHVTLGRVREGVRPEERRRIAEALGRVDVSGVAPWRVESVNLMRSTLTPAGAVYDRLAEVRLT